MDLLLEHPHSAPVVFPSVASLSLDNCRGTLYSLAQSFPNLLSIYLRSHRVRPYDHRLLDSTQKRTNSPQPMPFPFLSSIAGNQREILPLVRFFGHPDPKRHLSRIVLSMSQSGPGELTPATEISDKELRSFHIRGHLPIAWWENFVRSVPHLTFLNIILGVSHETDLDFPVSRPDNELRQAVTD